MEVTQRAAFERVHVRVVEQIAAVPVPLIMEVAQRARRTHSRKSWSRSGGRGCQCPRSRRVPWMVCSMYHTGACAESYGFRAFAAAEEAGLLGLTKKTRFAAEH